MQQLIRLKELLVSRLSLVMIIGILCVSCKATFSQNNDDYLLVNTIIKNNKEQYLDKTLVFELDRNNQSVISILNELYRYEKDNDIYKLDSLKHHLGIIRGGKNNDDRDENLDEIFNKKEYEHLLSQENNSEWDMNLIDSRYLEKTNSSYERTLKVSKPIYTSDRKNALIYFYKNNSSGILVYKMENGKWKEYKLIAPSMFQSKAEKFIYKN